MSEATPYSNTSRDVFVAKSKAMKKWRTIFNNNSINWLAVIYQYVFNIILVY